MSLSVLQLSSTMDHNIFSQLLLHPTLDSTPMPALEGHVQSSVLSHFSNNCMGNTVLESSLRNIEYSKLSNCIKESPRPKSIKIQPAEVITQEEYDLSIKNTPAYYLGLFVDRQLINWLISTANQHCKQQKNFLPVTEDEMRCFIAILFLSGYVDVPRRRMLWERSPDTHCSLVSNAMQRDRFELIFTALNSVDNNKDDNQNLGKLQALIDTLNEKFLSNSVLDDQHSIAECSVSSSFKHHNAKVPAKSLKIWCGCTKTGYCIWFNPRSNIVSANCHDEISTGNAVILRYAFMIQQFRPAAYSLLFENSYSETSLLYELQRIGVQGAGVDRDKAGCLLNPPLGGVDRLECNLNLYRISIRGKKLYSLLLTFCLDMALYNAWHVYKHYTEDKKHLDLLGFRRNIVIYYLEHYAKPILSLKGGRPAKLKTKGKRPPPSDARYDGIRHYVIPQEKQTRCAKCSAKTTTRCQKCDIGVHVKCFVDFHTRPKGVQLCSNS